MMHCCLVFQPAGPLFMAIWGLRVCFFGALAKYIHICSNNSFSTLKLTISVTVSYVLILILYPSFTFFDLVIVSAIIT